MSDAELQQLGQLITALQDALSQSEEREAQLKAELEMVKQDNRRLVEANLQLQQQIAGQSQPPAPLKLYGSSRPIGSNAELSKINSQNISWFD